MITVLDNYNLLRHNTFRIDAVCSKWIDYTSAEDLRLMPAEIEGNPCFSIGEGANILLTGNFQGVVLHSSILDVEMDFDNDGNLLIRAGSGLKMDDLIHYTCLNGWWGLENLSLIPGTVGASVVQNIGAYGVEIKDVVKEVECFDLQTRSFVRFTDEECRFSYRNSIFKDTDRRFVVTYVTYRLKKKSGPNLRYGNLQERFTGNVTLSPMMVREEIIRIRNEKLPPVDEIGSAGSFFKNPVITMSEYQNLLEHEQVRNGRTVSDIPHYLVDGFVKIPAAWLIEKCGFKGKEYGNVGVWGKQPLILVNLTGKATSDEVLELENVIIGKVESTFGIRLHPEVDHI